MDEKISEDGKRLPLVEQFYSIQGEGFHAGKPTYFIRIGGCNVRCPWCDSKNTWDPEVHPLVDVGRIKSEIDASLVEMVVVTGGEPTLYNLNPLSSELKSIGRKVFLETSGTGDFTGEWDWICLSPKRHTPPKTIFYRSASELKVIVFEMEDLEWAEEAAKSVGTFCKLYLQPEWSQFDKIIQPIVEYVKGHPQWNVSLQTHKFMRIP